MTDAITNLICFPHAGGSALTFAPWRRRLLAQGLDLHPVEPPGRITRQSEALPSTLPGLLEAVWPQIEALGDAAQDTVLYGHSLGSLLAFETARRLAAEGRPPRLLVVSGRNGPTRAWAYPTIHLLPDEEFLAAVSRMDLSMSALMSEPRLAEMFLPILRADIAVAHSYRYEPGALLPCPIVSVQGEQDPLVTPAGVAAWAGETTAGCHTRWLPGAHFFTLQRPEFLTELPALIASAGSPT